MIKTTRSFTTTQNRLLALLALGAAFIVTTFASLVPTQLLAAYPSFPTWAINAIQWAASAAAAISIIGWVVGAGLASLAFTYIKRYGIRLAINM